MEPYHYSDAIILNNGPAFDLAAIISPWIIRWQSDAQARAEASVDFYRREANRSKGEFLLAEPGA